MSKKTIVHLPEGQASGFIIADFWRSYFLKYFNMEVFDPDKTYDRNQHVFWISPHDKIKLDLNKINEFKIIEDHLWDNFGTSTANENIFKLISRNFIFINESIWYKWLKYPELDLYQNPSKFFLCLMRLQRSNRDDLYKKIIQYDNESLISYVAQNKRLINDIDINHGNFQRHVNPLWYNSTNFSLVSESVVNDLNFISEKSFKPFAFKHPLIIWGPANILDRIKTLGFQTFSHVIDESYDIIPIPALRLKKITLIINDLYKEYKQGKQLFTDNLSKEIIEHNYNLFYSDALINSIAEKEIFKPLVEFVYD